MRSGVTREQRPEETFIIAKTEEGFKVYSPASPTRFYFVSGTLEEPSCTCLGFQAQEVNPDYRCTHIQAVTGKFGREPEAEEVDPIATKERRGIQDENGAPQVVSKPRSPKQRDSISHMLLKRSVSPDGRIDSLSVEFSTPVEKLSAAEIRENAAKILQLQDGIVGGFKNGGGEKHAPKPAAAPSTGNGGGVAAKMLDVAGMPGKWGRRLFLNVQVNGDTLKLFGNRKQLAEAIEAAGYSDFGDVEEGLMLNVPCQVTTKQSPDNRYTNIDQIMPAQRGPQRRSW